MQPENAGSIPRDTVSRRRFLVGAATIGGAGVGLAGIRIATDRTRASGQALRPFSMAMHVHASASEGPGSMQAQLVQATRLGVDVLWWTEHDQRLCAHGAPSLITFTGMTEQDPTGHAAAWTWTAASSGTPLTTTHEFLARNNSNAAVLGDRAHALLLGVRAGSTSANHNLSGVAQEKLSRTTLAGMTISLDVYPTDTSHSSFLAVDILSSYRPADGGRPAGFYKLSYRLGGIPGATRLTNFTDGVVNLAAPVGRWSTVTIRPEQDLARIWPGVDGKDAAMFGFSVNAFATAGTTTRGYLAELRFDRAGRTGQKPLAIEHELITHYAPSFPRVKQIMALELSLCTPHLAWYGETVAIPDLTKRPPLQSADPAFARSLVDVIHHADGLASYCHPFGTDTTVAARAVQDAATATASRELIANRALGCDLLEVGYRARGGCDLDHHVRLWDNLSRNAIFVTGVGVSDDHAGRDWLAEKLNFTTTAWATDSDTRTLLDAMRRGRMYFGDPARFHGELDVVLNGKSAMGGVSISTAKQRTISLLATRLPAGGSVVMVRGLVDTVGQADVDPRLTLTRINLSRLDDAGRMTLDVDSSKPVFVRFVVLDSSGLEVAFTNPLWLLRTRPAAGIPAARLL